MGLSFPSRDSCIGSFLFKGKRWLCIIREDKGRKLHLLSGKIHGIISNTSQTWVQIIGIEHQQQDPTVGFLVANVLDEKNARQRTNAVALKGGVFIYFVSAWVSRNTELTISRSFCRSCNFLVEPKLALFETFLATMVQISEVKGSSRLSAKNTFLQNRHCTGKQSSRTLTHQRLRSS